jgi:cell division protein FtsB
VERFALDFDRYSFITDERMAKRAPDPSPGAHRPPQPAASTRTRTIRLLVGLVAVVLVVEAIVGEKGLLQMRRARRQYDVLSDSIRSVRQENARLREEARRLREDPVAIEAIARRDLGLARPGEVLFIIKDK